MYRNVRTFYRHFFFIGNFQISTIRLQHENYELQRNTHFVRISVEPHDLPARAAAVLPVERLHGSARAVLILCRRRRRLLLQRLLLFAFDVRKTPENGRAATVVRLLHVAAVPRKRELGKFGKPVSRPLRYYLSPCFFFCVFRISVYRISFLPHFVFLPFSLSRPPFRESVFDPRSFSRDLSSRTAGTCTQGTATTTTIVRQIRGNVSAVPGTAVVRSGNGSPAHWIRRWGFPAADAAAAVGKLSRIKPLPRATMCTRAHQTPSRAARRPPPPPPPAGASRYAGPEGERELKLSRYTPLTPTENGRRRRGRGGESPRALALSGRR